MAAFFRILTYWPFLTAFYRSYCIKTVVEMLSLNSLKSVAYFLTYMFVVLWITSTTIFFTNAFCRSRIIIILFKNAGAANLFQQCQDGISVEYGHWKFLFVNAATTHIYLLTIVDKGSMPLWRFLWLQVTESNWTRWQHILTVPSCMDPTCVRWIPCAPSRGESSTSQKMASEGNLCYHR